MRRHGERDPRWRAPLFHLVFPWILFIATFSLLNFSQKNYQGFVGRILFILSILFSPIMTKLNVFLEKLRITTLLSSNPETFLREKVIKDMKRTTRKPEDLFSVYDIMGKINAKEILEEMNDEEFVTLIGKEVEKKQRPGKSGN